MKSLGKILTFSKRLLGGNASGSPSLPRILREGSWMAPRGEFIKYSLPPSLAPSRFLEGNPLDYLIDDIDIDDSGYQYFVSVESFNGMFQSSSPLLRKSEPPVQLGHPGLEPETSPMNYKAKVHPSLVLSPHAVAFYILLTTHSSLYPS
ncbi:hypothetical protein AXF42_Ash017669 [Apostasia shenzhenica]|uniref:Uncharacterized protein n=1 Tax=Apostasia shenzhenica TaxID=1088818 RepID=A0A2I0A5H8_9ASPA|nr:hypothetical protein AXF42_Ash017669 [Apostasia shenzhenica]